MTQEQVHQLVYFPYLGLGRVHELVLGSTRIWNASLLNEHVAETELRARIAQLLATHRDPSVKVGASRPLDGIGVVQLDGTMFQPLTAAQIATVNDCRQMLFLGALSHNARLAGPNAGHAAYTAENFSVIYQNFSLSNPYISEATGVLVRLTHMGYKVDEVAFPTPTYVPRPIVFDLDNDLVRALLLLREVDVQLFRRILTASSLFLESYYNSEAVDLRARILLQVMAFEVLLDLPESQQRLAFKDAVEKLCNNRGERRFSYKYEVRRQRHREARSLKGIWADRFYALRNHIIHGRDVRQAEYLYRGQHHLMISPMFFVLSLKHLACDAIEGIEGAPYFRDRIVWMQSSADDDDDATRGFQLDVDFGAVIARHMARS